MNAEMQKPNLIFLTCSYGIFVVMDDIDKENKSFFRFLFPLSYFFFSLFLFTVQKLGWRNDFQKTAAREPLYYKQNSDPEPGHLHVI